MRRVTVAVVAALVLSSLPGVVGLPRAGAVSSATDPATLVNAPAADTGANDTQADPAAAAVGSNVVVAFTDSGSGAGHFTGWARSTNGGASFADKGALPASTEGDGGSPSLAADTGGNAIFLATNGLSTQQQIPVFKSTDGGATFGAPVNGANGAFGLVDTPSIAVDNFAGTCHGNVYLGWRQLGPTGMRLTRSTDGGATWGPTGGTAIASTTGGGATVVVGPDHAVYYFWLDNAGNIIRVRKSTDCGVNWAAAVVVADLATTGFDGDLALGQGFRTDAHPHAAVNPVSGEVYVAYNDDPPGADKGEADYVSSTDGGVTWSLPHTLTGEAPGSNRWSPALAFSANGKSAMTAWYHGVQGTGGFEIRRENRVGTASAGVLTLAPAFVTGPAFPPAVNQDPAVSPDYMGTHDAIITAGSNFVALSTDARDADLAHTHQPDIRVARAPVSGKVDVKLALTSTPEPGFYGSPVTLTATVTNTSTKKATDAIWLTMQVPPQLTVSSATTTGGACYTGGFGEPIVCRVSRLAATKTGTVVVDASPLALGAYTTTATVTAGTVDPNSANNTADAVTTVVSPYITDPSSLVNDPNLDGTPRDTQVGPSAAAAGTNVVAAYEDSGSNAGGGGNHHVGWSRSTDSGTHFTDKGTLPDSADGDTGRPAVAADTVGGQFYIAADDVDWGVQVFPSSDAGATFGAPARMFGHASLAPAGPPSLAVDNSTGPCAGDVYVAFRWTDPSNGTAGDDLYRSLDHGASWQSVYSNSNNASMLGIGGGPVVAVGTSGEVYLFEFSNAAQIGMSTSTSCGTSFSAPQFVASENRFGPFPMRGGINVDRTPSVAVNPGTGAVYVAYMDANYTVRYVRSTGSGFTTPVELGGGVQGTEFNPTIAFSSDGARVMVSWFDRHDDPERLWTQRDARLGTVSTSGDLTLRPPFATSPAFVPGGIEDFGVGANTISTGDAIVAAGTSFVSFWSDSRDRGLYHLNEPDIRFARLATTGSANVGVALTDSSDPIVEGGSTTLTATVTNHSTTATAPTTYVTVTMPAGLAATGATTSDGTCYPHAHGVSCSLGRLSAGEVRTATIGAVAVGTGTVTTTAVVSTSAKDGKQGNNTATTTTQLDAGSPGPAAGQSQNGPYAIADQTPIAAPVAITAPGRHVVGVTVAIRLDHPYDGDLVVSLQAPDGKSVELVLRRGANGDNFGQGTNDCSGTPAVLDDTAATFIGGGTPPFTAGPYQPEQLLGDLQGAPADGTWYLKVTDVKPGDTGLLGCAALTVDTV